MNIGRKVGGAAEQARASLAIIRHAVGKQGLPEEEHYFFRREMACAARIGRFYQRLPYWAFGCLSNYGYSLARPTIGIVALWIVAAFAYLLFHPVLEPVKTEFGAIGTAAGFSFSNLFAFLGFNRTLVDPELLESLPSGLTFLAAFQSVAGVILLFLLGLGLRNRFPLR